MNLKKMKKMAGWMEKAARFLQIAVVIAAAAGLCVTAVWILGNTVFPGITVPELVQSLDLGTLTITLSPEYQPTDSGITVWTWITLILYGVFAAGIWYILRVLRRIFRSMEAENPFCRTTVTDIRKIGWTVIGMGVSANLIQILEITDMWKRYGAVLEADELIMAATVNYTLDGSFLVIFAVLMLMSWIFAYGAELQQLSDETL